MANLAILQPYSLSTVVRNVAEANLFVGFASYLVVNVLLFHDNKEFSKQELVADIVSAGYDCWKWKMGLGPEPPVNTGIPDEVPRCKELTSG